LDVFLVTGNISIRNSINDIIHIKMETKFTFKTEKSTGRFRSFYPDLHYIKLKKTEVGSIDDEKPYYIRLKIFKSDINEDNNHNCSWKWIQLKKQSASLQEAKDFLNVNFKEITEKFNLYKSEI
jgi:hypothetical protein